MDETLKDYAESEAFSDLSELVKTVQVYGDQSYRIEVYKSYSLPAPLIFFAELYVKRPVPVRPEAFPPEFPLDGWASEGKVDEQDYPDADAALHNALDHVRERMHLAEEQSKRKH